jgi:hypothetical protein
VTASSWVPSGSCVLGVVGGQLSHLKELGIPFEADLIADIEAIGFQGEDAAETRRQYPQVPPFPAERPYAAFGLDDLLVGFGLYLASKITDKIISDIIHDVYEQIVKANLKKLWEKLRHEPRPPSQTIAMLDHWFDGSGVLVRVAVHLQPDTTNEDSTTNSVATALRQAVTYLHGHPITHRVLTYDVYDGHVEPQPRLSEPIEPLTDPR